MNESGQSTVEYAIVFTALLGVVVGVGALMNVVHDGLFVQHAVTSGSHAVSAAAGGIVDLFCF